MRTRAGLLLLCLFSCKSPEAPSAAPSAKPVAAAKPALAAPQAVKEQEPNDYQRAQLIPSRAVVDGSIAPPRVKAADDDWYRVEAGGTLALRVELKGELDAVVEVFDRDRNRLVRAHYGGEDRAVIPAVLCVGACFVKVSGTVAAPYQLTVLGAPPEAGQELEPNGRAVDATPLQAGKAMQGTFVSGDDEDWYRLELPSAGATDFLRVELSGLVGVRHELEVRALADGALLASFRASAPGEALLVRDLSLKLGAAPQGAAVDGGPAPEPGGSAAAPALPVAAPAAPAAAPSAPAAAPESGGPAAAPAAAPGAPSVAPESGGPAGAAAAPQAAPAVAPESGGPAAAAPEQAKAAAAPGTAPATASPAGAGSAGGPPANPGAAPVAAGAASLDAGAAPAAAAPPAGYYLVLKSSWYQKAGKSVRGASGGAYSLTASLETGPGDLEQEPNDDAQHATPLSATATGYLSPAGDTDWYRVHLDAPAVARVEVSGADRADLELAVFLKPGDKPIARANEGGPREGEILPGVGLPAGDSWVLVQAAARQLDGKWLRDGEDKDTPYKLSLALSPDDGATDREPNNDPATAQRVPLPSPAIKGYLWPRKDVDLFRFTVPQGHAPVSIKLPAVRGLDLMLRLYQLRGEKAEVIGSADQSKGEGDEQLLSVPLKEGDYAVEVSSPRSKDASATQPYTLSIQ